MEIDEQRKPSTLINALEAINTLFDRKKKADAQFAKLSPERQLCEQEWVKQRPFVLVDDGTFGCLKTIKYATKRWIMFEKAAKNDETYQKALQKLRKIEAVKQDKELYGFLKRLLIRGVEIPAASLYIDDKKVSYYCPFCGGHTMLAYGTEHYHCVKCGQKISSYNQQGIWGNLMLEDANRANEIVKQNEKHTKLMDLYEIGREYCLETDDLKGQDGEYCKKTDVYMLIGKYAEYGLFESLDGIRTAIRWNDIKEVK